MINSLAVLLFFKSRRDVLVSNQLIYNSLENYLEVLGKQILLLVSLYANLMLMVKKREAKFPKF